MVLTKKFIERFNLAVGVLVLLATMFGIWYQTKGQSPELTVEVLANDELTELSSTPNLHATFNYNGTNVSHLWKLVFRVKNSGNVTLVGKGKRSNLLEKDIPLSLGEKFKIIDFETTYNDLNLSIKKLNKNTISLVFDQWLSEESVVVSIYLEPISKKNISETPLPKSLTRSLINGSILIVDSSSIKGVIKEEPKYSFPSYILEPSKLIASLYIFICIIILAFAFIMIPNEYFKLRKWEKNNSCELHEHLDENMNDESKEKLLNHYIERFKVHPEMIPEFIWSSFQGERLNVNPISTTLQGTLISWIIVGIILLSIIVSFLGI